MRKFLLVAALAALGSTATAQHFKPYTVPKATSYGAPVYHSGYVKKSGSYVQPHYQTAPDSTKVNNWSSRPNVNPYTGKEGTEDPYAAGH